VTFKEDTALVKTVQRELQLRTVSSRFVAEAVAGAVAFAFAIVQKKRHLD
jgi:hypothetical protein